MRKIEEGLSPESARNLLKAAIAAFTRNNPTPTLEEQLEAIKGDFTAIARPEELLYTIKTAELLDQMVVASDIDRWYYVPRASGLDILKVDFIIVFAEVSIPIQITSTPKHGQAHRKSIRSMYATPPEEPPLIPVVQLVDRNGNLLADETIQLSILTNLDDVYEHWVDM